MQLSFDLNALDVSVFVVDVEDGGCFRIFGMNAAAERETGIVSASIEGKLFEEIFEPNLARTLSERYTSCVRTRKAFQFEELGSLVSRGDWYRTTLSPCLDPVTGDVSRIMAISQNITAIKKIQLELKSFAFTDALTGLANRRAFDQEVENGCAEAGYTGRSFSLAVADLNGLKRINDTLGHRFGDEVIRLVGFALKEALMPNETVARVGGDEFYLLLRDANRTALDMRLARLRAVVGSIRPSDVYSESFAISAGGAVWHPGDDVYEVLAAADADMYLEKALQSRQE
ncbi:diguanylate cyclase [Tianweitania sp. BSSL-BM11]|uniref:diguanylate cyclase n=1 Tax=Tianweitania aestuarii TaxID=2814886 RepID=A0ABS5RWM4_9HYPH|nr:sensor domain-containing diguanylate cyclase [Tianweitania aestuarii]MBS9721463.1 diguanylate cyclase [Tianweitania aestuarii]